MALEPTLYLKRNGDYVYLIDNTGLYDADVNDTGWGSPNATRASITRILINITLPSGTTETYDTDDATLTLSKLTGAGTSYFDVILAKKEIEFMDGQYAVDYTLYVGATEYTYSETFFSIDDIKCCVFKKFAAIVEDGNCLKNGKLLEALKYWTILKSIQFNAAGGTMTEAEYNLSKLEKWCNNSC
jgi:hypothetical protein